MSLKDRLNSDLKEAMRAKDKTRLDAVRALRGEILKIEKSGSNAVVDDESVVKSVKYLIKQRRDSIDQYTSAGRDDLAEKERAETAVLATYLPAQLSKDELKTLVQQTIEETGAQSPKDMGRVMGAIQGKIKATGKDADNRLVAELVKTTLNS